MAQQLTSLRPYRALILDLRGNAGGNLDVVRKCLELLFVESFMAGEFRDRRGRRSAFRIAGRGKRAFDRQVLLLIDQGTGSGAEVFAATVKDARRGTLIGRNTRGQVLLAKDYDLGYGYSATIAHHDYYTSAGARIEGRGVLPDEQVSLRIDDFRQGRDADLIRARELIDE
jgi:carboxyl-terminal processing protease